MCEQDPWYWHVWGSAQGFSWFYMLIDTMLSRRVLPLAASMRWLRVRLAKQDSLVSKARLNASQLVFRGVMRKLNI